MYSSRRFERALCERVVRKFRTSVAIAQITCRCRWIFARSHLHRAPAIPRCTCKTTQRDASRSRSRDTISLCPIYGDIMEHASEHYRKDAASRSPPTRQVGRPGLPGVDSWPATSNVTSEVLRRRPGGRRTKKGPRIFYGAIALDYANNGDLLSCLPCRRDFSPRSRRMQGEKFTGIGIIGKMI